MKEDEKDNKKALFATAVGGLVTGIVGLASGTAMAVPIAIGGGIGLIVWGVIDLSSEKK
jgi:xanthine/uracil permease